MASSYPGGLDAFVNPSASDTLDSATVPHAEQHSNANDAIEAIESTLGVNPQGSSGTVTARLTALDSTVAGKASTTHAASHGVAGSDPVTVASSQVTGLAASATTDTTDASNITSGTLPDARLTNTGTAGTYTKVTTDSKGRVTSGTTLVLGDLPAGVARTGSANAFTVGGHTITNAAATDIPLLVSAHASQSANLFQINGTAGTRVFEVGSGGYVVTSSGMRASGGFLSGSITGISGVTSSFFATAANNIPIAVRGAASQTANLQEWQNSSGTVLSRITSAGAFVSAVGGHTITAEASGIVPLTLVHSGSGTADLLSLRAAAGNPLTGFDAAGRLYIRSQSGNLSGAAVHVFTNNTAIVGQVIRGSASQTANLQEWQNSSGTVLSRVDSAGRMVVDSVGTGASSPDGIAWLYVTPKAGLPASTLQVNRGLASQTGDLQQWQASNGTVLGRINSYGSLRIGTSIVNTAIGLNLDYAGVSSGLGLVIRGAASQTADLMQFQNSAGGVIGYVTSAAVMRMEIVQGGSGAETDLRRISGGGVITLQKATSAVANGGTNYGRLYLRDGTTAGTLKLVIRAGTAGAETTILDNIPQT